MWGRRGRGGDPDRMVPISTLGSCRAGCGRSGSGGSCGSSNAAATEPWAEQRPVLVGRRSAGVRGAGRGRERGDPPVRAVDRCAEDHDTDAGRINGHGADDRVDGSERQPHIRVGKRRPAHHLRRRERVDRSGTLGFRVRVHTWCRLIPTDGRAGGSSDGSRFQPRAPVRRRGTRDLASAAASAPRARAARCTDGRPNRPYTAHRSFRDRLRTTGDCWGAVTNWGRGLLRRGSGASRFGGGLR
jgi:hypothetical protein